MDSLVLAVSFFVFPPAPVIPLAEPRPQLLNFSLLRLDDLLTEGYEVTMVRAVYTALCILDGYRVVQNQLMHKRDLELRAAQGS